MEQRGWRDERDESGVMPAAPSAGCATDTSDVCDDLLNQTSIASMNLEFLIECSDGESRAAAEDAQTSVKRIGEIARALQAVLDETAAATATRHRRSA